MSKTQDEFSVIFVAEEVKEEEEIPEFDYSFNPCPIMFLQEGVIVTAIIEMIIYTLGVIGMGIMALSVPEKRALIFLLHFIIFILVGPTFVILLFGAFKREKLFCLPSAFGIGVAFIGRFVIFGLRSKEPLSMLCAFLSICELYFLVIILAYVKDIKNRPKGPHPVPELFGEPLNPDGESPYNVRILSTDSKAASVRNNPRFRFGFP